MKKEKNRKKAVAFILAAVVVVVVMFGFVIPSSAAADSPGLGVLQNATVTVDYTMVFKTDPSVTLSFRNQPFTLSNRSVWGSTPTVLGLTFSDGFALLRSQADGLGYYISQISFNITLPASFSSQWYTLYTSSLKYSSYYGSAFVLGKTNDEGSAQVSMQSWNGWDVWYPSVKLPSVARIQFILTSTEQNGLYEDLVLNQFTLYSDRGELAYGMTDGQIAYQQGYLDADRRHANDYQNGYDAGYEASKPGIYQSGYDAGLETGYDEGVKVGYTKGEQDGYNRGVSVGKGDVNLELRKLLFSVVDTPVRAGLGFMNFEFLGYNLLQAFEAVMTVLFVGVCVYFVMKFI